MYKIEFKNFEDCRCFQRRAIEHRESFSAKIEAKMEAQSLIYKMEDNFCGLHEFSLSESEDRVVIDCKKVR